MYSPKSVQLLNQSRNFPRANKGFLFLPKNSSNFTLFPPYSLKESFFIIIFRILNIKGTIWLSFCYIQGIASMSGKPWLFPNKEILIFFSGLKCKRNSSIVGRSTDHPVAKTTFKSKYKEFDS